MQNQCTICQGEFKQKPVTLQCQHFFCRICISEWIKMIPNCPLCKTPCSRPTIKKEKQRNARQSWCPENNSCQSCAHYVASRLFPDDSNYKRSACESRISSKRQR